MKSWMYVWCFIALVVCALVHGLKAQGPVLTDEPPTNGMVVEIVYACPELVVVQVRQRNLQEPMSRYQIALTYDSTILHCVGGDTINTQYTQELYSPSPNPPNAVYAAARVPAGAPGVQSDGILAVFLFVPLLNIGETGSISFFEFPPAIIPTQFFNQAGAAVQPSLNGAMSRQFNKFCG